MSEALVALSSIVVLGFQASAIPMRVSYPIEVGLASVHTGELHSWLIRPTDRWIADGYWDPESERVHGISRDVLLDQGVPIGLVRTELAEAVAGHPAVCEAIMADTLWLRKLHGGTPSFRLSAISAVFHALILQMGSGGRGELARAIAEAGRRFPQAHRAGSDARRGAEVIRILTGLA